MTGKGYVWIITGWYGHEWWDPQNDTDVTCTLSQMKKAVKGYIAVNYVTLGDPDVLTVANIVSI